MATEPTTDLIFEDPPANRSPIAAWLHTLRQHPGKWAKYPERVPTATRANITRGAYAGIRQGEFEAKGRNSADDRCDLYARYVGGES